MRRAAGCAVAVTILGAATGGSAAHELPSGSPGGSAPSASYVDTEHIFGITMGSDIGETGELELEIETYGGLGKRFGRYASIVTLNQLKYTVADRLRIAPGFSAVANNIAGVPGWLDARGGGFSGASLEIRAKLLDRAVAPFGLTLHIQPGWTRRDEPTGLDVTQYGSEFALLADKELLRDRLYGAINLWYGVSGGRTLGLPEWTQHSDLALHGALSYRIAPSVLIGGEIRYVRAYEGLGLDRFEGDALYVGPTFSTTPAKHMGLSGSFGVQVYGRALGDGRALNLEQFERYQGMLRYNYHF